MGALAADGHDKVTIQTSPSIAALGNWIEQLIAESTGKEGKGLLPVVGATIGKPHDYSTDRLFVYLRVEGDDNAETDAGITTLAAGGAAVRHAASGRHLRDWRRILPLGIRDGGGGQAARHQPVRRAERHREQEQYQPPARLLQGTRQPAADQPADRLGDGQPVRRRQDGGDALRPLHPAPVRAQYHDRA